MNYLRSASRTKENPDSQKGYMKATFASQKNRQSNKTILMNIEELTHIKTKSIFSDHKDSIKTKVKVQSPLINFVSASKIIASHQKDKFSLKLDKDNNFKEKERS